MAAYGEIPMAAVIGWLRVQQSDSRAGGDGGRTDRGAVLPDAVCRWLLVDLARSQHPLRVGGARYCRPLLDAGEGADDAAVPWCRKARAPRSGCHCGSRAFGRARTPMPRW